MSKKRLVICDSEQLYAEKLGERLEESQLFPFEITVYTDMERLIRGLKEGRFDILLLGKREAEAISEIEDYKSKPLIIRLEEEGREIEGRIWKYQSVTKIRNKILELYEGSGLSESSREGSVFSGRKQTRIIGLYSPSKGDYTEYISFQTAKILSARGAALYLSAEPFSYLREALGNKEGKDISDLIYFSRAGAERFSIKFALLTDSYANVNYVLPAGNYEDLEMAEAGDWINLLENTVNLAMFDFLVINLSEIVKELPKVLEKCDLIIMPYIQNKKALMRIRAFEENLKALEHEEVLEKLLKMEVKEGGDLTDISETPDIFMQNTIKEGLTRLVRDEL